MEYLESPFTFCYFEKMQCAYRLFWYLQIPTYIYIMIIFSSNVSKKRPIEVIGTIRSQPKNVPQSKDRISRRTSDIHRLPRQASKRNYRKDKELGWGGGEGESEGWLVIGAVGELLHFGFLLFGLLPVCSMILCLRLLLRCG
jgi:hypothetical protein